MYHNTSGAAEEISLTPFYSPMETSTTTTTTTTTTSPDFFLASAYREPSEETVTEDDYDDAEETTEKADSNEDEYVATPNSYDYHQQTTPLPDNYKIPEEKEWLKGMNLATSDRSIVYGDEEENTLKTPSAGLGQYELPKWEELKQLIKAKKLIAKNKFGANSETTVVSFHYAQFPHSKISTEEAVTIDQYVN